MKRNKELKKEGYSESNMEECPFQVLAESESEISYHFFFLITECCLMQKCSERLDRRVICPPNLPCIKTH